MHQQGWWFEWAIWFRCIGIPITTWILFGIGIGQLTFGVISRDRSRGIVSGTICMGFAFGLILIWLIIIK